LGILKNKIISSIFSPHIKYLFGYALGEWNGIEISRQTINNILKKPKRNGSPYKGGKKNWNYFRAIWQMDVKDPKTICSHNH